MIWNLLLVSAIAALVIFTWLYFKHRSSDGGYYSMDPYESAVFLSAILTGALLLVSVLSAATNSYDVARYKRSAEVLELKAAQRDNLAKIVREELTAEQYRDLLAATPDADLLVIIGTEASSVLRERAERLVALNSDLYRAVNDLAEARVGHCAWSDNVFTPRLFVSPECPKPLDLDVDG